MPVAKLINVDRGCASHRVDLQWEDEASRKKLKTVSYCLFSKPNIYDSFALFPSLLFCWYQFNFEVNFKKCD
jgi:hypothetical protein